MLALLLLLTPLLAFAEGDLVDCPPAEGKVMSLSLMNLLRDLSKQTAPRYADRELAFREWERERNGRRIGNAREPASVGRAVESGILGECEKGTYTDREFCRELQSTQRKMFRLFEINPDAEIAASFDPGELNEWGDLGNFDRAEGMIYLRFRFGKP